MHLTKIPSADAADEATAEGEASIALVDYKDERPWVQSEALQVVWRYAKRYPLRDDLSRKAVRLLAIGTREEVGVES